MYAVNNNILILSQGLSKQKVLSRFDIGFSANNQYSDILQFSIHNSNISRYQYMQGFYSKTVW